MTENEFSKRLKEECERQMPDMLSEIKKDCEKAPQIKSMPKEKRSALPLMKGLGAVAACLILFIGGLFTGRLFSSTDNGVALSPAPAETVIYMDVNPSVELTLDSDGRVLSCSAGNGDGESLLSNLELRGVERDTALSAILGAMYLNGYLSEENNSVLISVDGVGEEPSKEMLASITEKIDSVFRDSDISCSIIAQPLTVSEQLKAKASEYGVSPGKMYLVEKLVEGLDMLSQSDLPALSSLSVAELNLLYSSATEDGEEFASDIVSGVISGFMRAEEAITALLESIGQNSSFLEEYDIDTSYTETENGITLIYTVKMRFKFTNNFYSFTIDCRTGELLETDFESGLFPN